MALSPSIPTSFVPKQPVSGNPRRASGNNLFLVVAFLIFLLALVGCGATFLYTNYLKGVESSKGEELIAEQKKIDPNTVEQFVELKNRLLAAQTIINQHVELSQFLTTLGNVTLTDVSFNTMTVQVADDRTATLVLTGKANNFNALAAESKQFAAQPLIKSAIFSNITPNKDNTVTFSINATLDPRIVVESTAPANAGLLPASTSTPVSALPSLTNAASTTP